MGYCNYLQVQRIVAQALTSSSPEELTTQVDLLTIGNVFDTNMISTEIIEQYITWGEQEINAAISALYKTPLDEKSDFETTLVSIVSGAGSGSGGGTTSYFITEGPCPFQPGDSVLFVSGTVQERHEAY